MTLPGAKAIRRSMICIVTISTLGKVAIQSTALLFHKLEPTVSGSEGGSRLWRSGFRPRLGILDVLILGWTMLRLVANELL